MGKPRKIARRHHTVQDLKHDISKAEADSQLEPETKWRRIEEFGDLDDFDGYDLTHDSETPIPDASTIEVSELSADELNRRVHKYVTADAENFEEPTFQVLQDLQQLAQYQEGLLQVESVPVVEYNNDSEEEVDDVSNRSVLQSSAEPVMIPPSRRSSSAFLQDASVPVPQAQSIHTRSKFILALGLWVKEAGLS